MQAVHEDEHGQDSGAEVPEERVPLKESDYLATGFVFSDEVKDNLLLFFGVILPVCAVAFETGFHFCARYFFDPFPSTNHIVLFSLIPLSNLMVWMTRRKNLSMHFAFMSLASGMAMGVALMYALMFLPLTGPAMFSLAYLGFGLLGLTPLLSIPCLWFSGKKVCHLAEEKKTYFEAHQVKHFGHIVVLVMVLAVELPSTLTRMNLGLAVHHETEAQGIEWLRKYGNEEVLLRACYERSGRATDILGSMYESGHPIKIEDARRVFYRVTGKPFNSVPIPASARSTIRNAGLASDPAGLNAVVEDEFDLDADVAGEQVSGVVRGLSAHDSSIQVGLQPDALFASMDWSFHFGNTSKYDREARGKIMLPPGAVVTRATLTVAGVEHDATIMVREAARAVYQEAVKQHKEDPLLVSVCGPDQILVQCFPVHPGGDLKVNLHIVAPMVLGETNGDALVSLPAFVERNFQLDEASTIGGVNPKETAKPSGSQSFSIQGLDASKLPLTEKAKKEDDGLKQVLNDQLSKFQLVLAAKRNEKCTEVAVEDRFLYSEGLIRREIGRNITAMPETLTVLIDGSVSMKDSMDALVKGLRKFPKDLNVQIIILADEPIRLMDKALSAGSAEFETALLSLSKYKPAGGQDNSDSLLELASENQRDNQKAILWIHGAQPICSGNSESLAAYLKMRSTPLLYDLQVAPGPVELLASVRNCAGYRHVSRTGSIDQDLTSLASTWKKDYKVATSVIKEIDNGSGDSLAELPKFGIELSQLLAYERLIEDLQFPPNQASYDVNELAKNYHLVTPISSAVVVDEIAELDRVSLPPPKAEFKPDPVLVAKDYIDHSFDHIDAFFAYTKYELVDQQVHPTLKSMHPGNWNIFGFQSGTIEGDFDTLTRQMNRLNAVTEESSRYCKAPPAAPVMIESLDGGSASVGGSTGASSSAPPADDYSVPARVAGGGAYSSYESHRLRRRAAKSDRSSAPRYRSDASAGGSPSGSSDADSFLLQKQDVIAEKKAVSDEYSSAYAPKTELPSLAPSSISIRSSVNAKASSQVAAPALAPAPLAESDGMDSSSMVADKRSLIGAEQVQKNLQEKERAGKDSNAIGSLLKSIHMEAGKKRKAQVAEIEFANNKPGAGARDKESQSIDSLNTEEEPGGTDSPAQSGIYGNLAGVSTASTPSPETLRIDSMRFRAEHQNASKTLTMLSLIFGAASALMTLKNSQAKNNATFCRAILVFFATPTVFYVLFNFLVPLFEQFFRSF